MDTPAVNLPPNRRSFVRTFLAAGVTSVLGALVRTDTLLAQVLDSGLPSGFFAVRLTSFPVLLKDGGSVRLGINRLSGTSTSGGYYPVIINRESAATFHALDSECTHASCVVAAYSVSTKASVCPCHGSRFGIDGRWLSGPAGAPLRTYPIRFDGVDTLTIEIPNLGFSVATSTVIAGSRTRLVLAFPSTLGAEHELMFRPTMLEPWTLLKFASTPEGLTDKSFVSGNDRVLKLYVDPPAVAGFYAVTIRVKSV